MEEEAFTLSSNSPLTLEEICRRLKVLSEVRRASHDHSGTVDSKSVQAMEALRHDLQEKCRGIEEKGSTIDELEVEDLEKYLEFLRKQLHSIQEENEKVSNQIESLTDTLTQDSARLDADVNEFDHFLKLINFRDTGDSQVVYLSDGTVHQEQQQNSVCTHKDLNIEIMELDFLIERHKYHLPSLIDLEQHLKRVATKEKLEVISSGVKVIDTGKNCIQLLFQPAVKVSDDILHGQKLGSSMQHVDFTHEVTIELISDTLQLKTVKVSSTDAYFDEAHIAKFSRYSLFSLSRKIQQRILLCSLRRFVVKEVNNLSSRYSITYSDKDETVTAHLVCGVDAYIKIPQGWPILDFGLKLISIIDVNKNISLSILCKIKGIANSLETKRRHQLAGFVDAVEEILVQEMQVEFRTSRADT